MSRKRHATLGALVLLCSGCAAGALPPVTSDADRLSLARAYHERGNCDDAITLLKSYVTSASGSANVDEAIYLLGDCYVRTKEYASGAAELERLLRDYPESDSAAAAAFRLGDAYWGQARPAPFDQEQTMRALGQWQLYLHDYPTHWQNEQAKGRVARARERLAEKAVRNGQLYLKLGLRGPAKVYFRSVIQEFGDTPQALQAELGLALVEEREGDRRGALVRLERLIAEHPDTSVARRAMKERARVERELRKHGERPSNSAS